MRRQFLLGQRDDEVGGARREQGAKGRLEAVGKAGRG